MPGQCRVYCSRFPGAIAFSCRLLCIYRLSPGSGRSQAPGPSCHGYGWQQQDQKMAHRLSPAPLQIGACDHHQDRPGSGMPHCQGHWRKAAAPAPLRMQRLPLRESPALLREGRRDETGCIYGSCQCLSSSLRLKPRNQKRVL